MRNTREATSVARLFDARAGRRAGVHAGVVGGLGRTTGGNQFTLPNLKTARDAWADIGKVKQKLPELGKTRR